MSMEQKLYSVSQACQKLGISRACFYNMKSDGLIPEPVIAQEFKYAFFSETQLEEIRKNLRPQGRTKLS